ncbi:PREDICTED: putative gustatory receptor 28a [Vollenhovia emeryi]|uniref:putative gustatory receptor 28a n=1 Tax=Vollenhovia emeryi TaxID=411798 RepID=UPI0005F572AF|nr:PREDICTED: putative gustatory receptor 28a [Vollenhovia emeryi]
MEEENRCKNVVDSVRNLFFVDVNKISNFFKSLSKGNVTAETNNKRKVMKIKSESHQDSFWMLKMSITFFKLIGLATLSRHSVITREKKTPFTFQHSKFGIIYNVALSILVLASNYLSVPFRLTVEYANKSNLTISIEIVQAILGSLVTCAILFSYCINQKLLVRIANQLVDIEHEMDRLYRLYRPLRRQRTFCALINLCILKICLLILLVITDFLAFHTSPVSWLSDIMPTFHVGWLLIQYFMLATIVHADFVDVNQAIQSLTRPGTPDLRPQSLSETRRVVISNSIVHQLLPLRDMHCHLCEISEDISDFYSLPVLFGIAFLFLTLIFNGYYLLSPLLISSQTLEYEVLSNTIIWLIFLIYPISLLANRITKIVNEVGSSVGKTGNVIHGLLSCLISKETKSEVKHFSLQLLHRKVQFTANGYFALDNNFLHSLVGTVATYLVILVQFQMGSSCSSRPQCNCTRQDLLRAK